MQDDAQGQDLAYMDGQNWTLQNNYLIIKK